MRNTVQEAIMNLLSVNSDYGKGKRFYGYFLLSMRKIYNNPQIPTAAVSITDQLNLYVNLDYFDSLSLEQRVELLEHECKHVTNYHHERFKALDEHDAKLWNYACDVAINEPLKSLHTEGFTVDKLKQIIPNLKHNETAEYYYSKLKEYRDNNGGKGGKGDKKLDSGDHGKLIDNHDVWNDKAENETIDEISKQTVKRAMKDAVSKCGGRGNVPIEILKELDALNSSNVNWKQQLKQFFAKADKFSKEPTRKKPNRRYKHLNPGRRKKPLTHIAIGVDESGSVSDALHKQFFSEIDAAARLDGIRFTIINADCTVNKVFDYVAGMRIERTGSGGTAYMPAINAAVDLKVDGMIYFGDGDIFGEKLTKPKFPFLWAMEDGRNAPADWGKVCHVKYLED